MTSSICMHWLKWSTFSPPTKMSVSFPGMSVLQCASLALKDIVRKLENSKSPNHTTLHTLHQEQMMETLECLLHMGSHLHTMVRPSSLGLCAVCVLTVRQRTRLHPGDFQNTKLLTCLSFDVVLNSVIILKWRAVFERCLPPRDS